jgi:hypothetical protein
MSAETKAAEAKFDAVGFWEQVSYDGFDPAKIRKDMKLKGDQLMKAVILYTALGNNDGRAAKSKDIQATQAAIRDLRSVTNERLSRIGICYAAAVLRFRELLQAKKKLPIRIPDCKLEPLYQDPCFSGYISKIGIPKAEYMDFLIKFDKLINKKPDEKRVETYLENAIAGSSSDNKGYNAFDAKTFEAACSSYS